MLLKWCWICLQLLHGFLHDWAVMPRFCILDMLPNGLWQRMDYTGTLSERGIIYMIFMGHCQCLEEFASTRIFVEKLATFPVEPHRVHQASCVFIASTSLKFGGCWLDTPRVLKGDQGPNVWCWTGGRCNALDITQIICFPFLPALLHCFWTTILF